MKLEERIVLNRKNIKADKLRSIVRKQGLGSKLLDDASLLKSRRSLVPDNTKKDIWIFGYGSLIWNPVIRPIKKLKVKSYGYRRKYCLKTHIGRGSKECPGLVLGLENGGSVTGQALKINNKNIFEELDLVWRREMIMGAYIPKIISGYSEEGKIDMIAFTINKKHENYIGSLSEAETALMISKAQGFLGTATDYLDKTCESLKILNLNDLYLKRLQARIINKNFV